MLFFTSISALSCRADKVKYQHFEDEGNGWNIISALPTTSIPILKQTPFTDDTKRKFSENVAQVSIRYVKKSSQRNTVFLK